MLAKYRGWSDRDLWIEYARLKATFAEENPCATEQQYDEFISQTIKQLGL